MKKSQIEEIIDQNGNLIGSDDNPKTGKDLETMANRTTDYNAKVHGQNYKNDFLGRFGFYFYESKEDASKLQDALAMIFYEKFRETLKYYKENPKELEADYTKHFGSEVKKDKMIDDTDHRWAEKVMDVIEPHLKKKLDEGKVDEEKLLDKKKKNRGEIKDKKSDDHEIPAKVKKVADVLSKLPKKQLDQLINLLEKKR
jgi:hypothetical protein